MTNNQPALQNSKQEENPIQALAAQFQMSQEETTCVINIVQESNPSLELLKQPKVLMLINQRKGRWVKEEEDFAIFLSEEFLHGLADIDNGTTKRAYLSGKLACTKMRISKKFKGQSTGKEVFTRREAKPDGRILSPQEILFYKRMHVELEKKFIKAVLKTVIEGSLRNAQKKKGHSSPTHTPPPPPGIQNAAQSIQMSNASCARDSTGNSLTSDIGCIQKAEVFTPGPLQNPHGGGQLNIGFQAGLSSSATNNTSTHLKGPAVTGPASTGVQPVAISNQSTGPSILPGHSAATSNPTQRFPNPMNSMTVGTLQMPPAAPMLMCSFNHNAIPAFQRNFAKNQVKTEVQQLSQFPAFINVNQNMSGPINCVGNQRINDIVPNDGTKKRPICNVVGSMGHTFPPLMNTEAAKRFKPRPTGTASQAMSISASEPSSNDESESAPSSNEASYYSNGMSTHRGAKPENHCGHNDIPDLLSGFDKHVAFMKEVATKATSGTTENKPIPEDSHFFAGAGGIGESPYITSKSFDEMHQFLGKGLSTDKLHNKPEMSLLDLNQSGNHLVCHNSTGHRSAYSNIPKQVGPPLSFGAFFSHETQVPGSIQAHHNFKPQSHFNRRYSTSNSSDMTASD